MRKPAIFSLIAFGLLAPDQAWPQTDPFISVPAPPSPQAAPRPVPAPAPAVAAPRPGPPPPRRAPVEPPAPTPTQWNFRCPGAGTVVVYSDRSTHHWLGADPADPLTCIGEFNGSRRRLVLGVYDADIAMAGRIRDAYRELIARGPGATVRMFGASLLGGASDASYSYVLTFERLERVHGPWNTAGSNAALVAIRQTGSGTNHHQSVVRHWFDLTSSVVLRRDVELISGTTRSRNREATQITAPGASRS